MLELTSARYIDGYRIEVSFNNGHSGIIDLTDALWGPVFEPLRRIEAFRRFEVCDVLHTIRWENDADLAPEYLHTKMTEQAESIR